jgi:sulfur relay (sulfurtransferase) DsrC/TusE family protein
MAKLNVNDIANESAGENFDDFTKNFATAIENLGARNAYDNIKGDKEYALDDDGYIIGDVWSEQIASEIMDLNGFVATVARLEALVIGRELFGQGSLSPDHKIVAEKIGVTPSAFLKMFPKYPIVYYTRWGGMRKPFNLQTLLDTPIR